MSLGRIPGGWKFAGLDLAVALVVMGISAAPAAACGKTWTGAGNDGKASDPNNWSVCPNSGPSVPTAADDVSIEGAGITINLDTGLTVHSWSMGTQPGSGVTLIGRTVGNNTGITAPGGFTNGPHGTIILDGGNGAVTLASASGAGSGSLANQGTITLESTSPTANAGLPALVGNLTNTGTITVQAASTYQGGYTFDNRGGVKLQNGAALSTTGAGPTTFINDSGGSIDATGTSNLAMGLGTFEQGSGTTSGQQPVILTGLDTLDFTGAGASHFLSLGGMNLTGTISPEQSVYLINGQPNAYITAQNNVTNRGTITLDAKLGDVALDMRTFTLTNLGTLILKGASSGAQPSLSGDLLNQGSFLLESNAMLGPGVNSTTTLQQTAGRTVLAPGVTFDFGHAQAGFTLSGGRVSGTGTLFGAGVTNIGGVVGPGSPGVLSVTGFYTQKNSGTLAIPVNGTAASQYGRVAVSGPLTLGGTLELNPSSAYLSVAQAGDSITPLSFGGTRTGTFSMVKALPALHGCKVFAPTYDDAHQAVEVTVKAPACPPLKLTQLSFAQSSFSAKTGTTLRATLSAAATLKIVVTERVEGPCGGGTHRCPRTVTRATLHLPAHAGANHLAFRVPSLGPGKYTAQIVASASGHHSNSVSLPFRIIRSS